VSVSYWERMIVPASLLMPLKLRIMLDVSCVYLIIQMFHTSLKLSIMPTTYEIFYHFF